MSVAANVHKDFFDHATSYFTQAKPREFFKTLHHLFFWKGCFAGKETSAVKAALCACPKVFDAFNALDLMDNLNNLRNHILGKDVKDLSVLMADTVGSACDAACWFSCVGIVSIGAAALDYLMIGSGAAMMYSFAKHSVQSIKDLRNQKLNNDEKKIKLLETAKNISLFAIGALLVVCGLLAVPLMINLLAFLGAVTVISNFAVYMIQNMTGAVSKKTAVS